MTRKHNAYGASLHEVERLHHPRSLVWKRLTWITTAPGGERVMHTAKTLPGGDVNRQLELLLTPAGFVPEGAFDIILNGRSQVIHVARHEAEEPPR